MIWLKSPPDYFWSSTVSGFRVGDFSNTKNDFVSPKAYKIDSYKAIFDTATSLIYVPQCIDSFCCIIIVLAIANEFIQSVLGGMRSQLLKEYGMYMVTCDTKKFQKVSLYLGGYWVEINPESYVLNVRMDQISQCALINLGPRKPASLCAWLLSSC